MIAPGATPAVAHGEYHLRVWRGDYLKESRVEISEVRQTN